MIEREFKGVWIPAEVWLDPGLSLAEKALLAEIDSFSGNGKSFYKSNDTIVREYQISKSTISRAVKRLQDLGYIEVKSDGRNRYITTRPLSRVKMTTQPRQNDHAEASKRGATNTLEQHNYNTEKEGVVEYPWNTDAFKAAWNGYLEMRWAQHRFKYKTLQSQQTALHKLQNLAQGSEQVAIAIIAESVAWGWKGLFPLKKQNHEPTGTTDGSLIAEHLRKLGSKS